jgi:hypothetical protein
MENELEKMIFEIKESLKALELAENPNNEDDFLDYCLEIANLIRKVAIISIHSIPIDRAETFEHYTQLEATVVGNIVRLYKLYDMLTLNLSKDHTEIVAILIRLIIESGGYLNYLINSNDDSKKNYILVSHKPNKYQLNELLKIKANRTLKPIEQRMYERIQRLLTEDGVSEKEILENKQWKLDGKSIEQLIKKTTYDFGFRGSSIHVHGSWHDLSIYHLTNVKGGYLPRTEYYPPDSRYINPISILMVGYLIEFLKWNKSDPQKILTNLLNDINNQAKKIEVLHEKYWDEEYSKWKSDEDYT